MASEKRLQTPKGRLSFPFLFAPRKAEKVGDKEKFSLTLIIDAEAQKTPEWQAIRAEVGALATAKGWMVSATDGNGKTTKSLAKGVRNPIHKGSEKTFVADGVEKPLPGYDLPGCVYISATSERAPGVIGGDMKPCTAVEAYAGCYVRATVTVYVYDRKDGRGITFGLRNVQKLAEGEPFSGGGGDPTKDFAPVDGFTRQGPAADFATIPTGQIVDDDSIPF